MQKKTVSNINTSKPCPERTQVSETELPPIIDGLINTGTSKSFNNFCEALRIAKTIDVFFAKIKELLIEMNIKDFILSRLSGFGNIENLITTLPHEISKIYQQDLILRYALNTNVPIFFSQITDSPTNLPDDRDLVEQNKEIFRLIVDFNFFDFCIIPIGECNERRRVILTVAINGEEHLPYRNKCKNNSGVLIQLTKAIDTTGTQNFPGFFLFKNEKQQVVLTPQQLVVLNLMYNYDLNLLQVATKLGLSRHTIDKHIGNAKKALGTKTIHGAMCRAVEMGFIVPNLDEVFNPICQ